METDTGGRCGCVGGACKHRSRSESLDAEFVDVVSAADFPLHQLKQFLSVPAAPLDSLDD
jgi:hypothetical protein